ncbi:helix-turn-helix transcriptional regulator [Micromonospora sp. CPCC 206060]|uniref:helix-turn-helix domain-containing protein n=1 Tax=Micromonospora sp. CPCC 206060 TaxID=3122406 RepID=UPI002FF1A14B
MEQSASTMPRRQLGRYLQQLRDEGNLSIKTVSEVLDGSRQKIWRIEQGVGPVRPADVQLLCEVYQAPTELVGRLIDLARQTRVKGWWQAYDDIMPDWFEPYVMMEAEATTLRHYDTELIHGLLQTPDYMAEVIRTGRPELTGEQRDRRIELRLRRQRLLNRRGPTAPRVEFVLNEAVLRRPLADHPAMVAQLRHLLAVGEQPNVSLRVLPLWAGPHPASLAGTFSILEFSQPKRESGEPTVVYQEGPTGALYLDRPVEVACYQEIWAGLVAVTLDETQSRQVIASFAGEAR